MLREPLADTKRRNVAVALGTPDKLYQATPHQKKTTELQHMCEDGLRRKETKMHDTLRHCAHTPARQAARKHAVHDMQPAIDGTVDNARTSLSGP